MKQPKSVLDERRIQRAMARVYHHSRAPKSSAAKDETTTLNPAAPAAPAAVARDPLGPLVARLSNWQRHQWARAGYPNSAKKLTEFALMERPT